MRFILVIDDDVDTRRTLREFLTDEGFTVHTARDGQHALNVLERIPLPDLILLDYKMPVMDGKQFLAVLRRTPQFQAIPVIILSAATREWSGANLEVVDVLTKPVDLDLLLNTLSRIFATS
jgi:CheY-like chemotaxis protein